MSDDDLIRRGEVRELLQQCGLMGNHPNDPLTTLFNEIPAAQVTVKPLEWEVCPWGFVSGGNYTIDTTRDNERGNILLLRKSDPTMQFDTIEAAKAAARADYDASIRSALTVTPHDPAKVQALVEAAEAQLQYMDMCNDKGDLERNLRAALAAMNEG